MKEKEIVVIIGIKVEGKKIFIRKFIHQIKNEIKKKNI
jgi:hypothetical protein